MTETAIAPAVAMSSAVIDAFSEVLLTTVVARLDPPHKTTEFGSNFFPVTFKVKAAPPALPIVGDNWVTEGTGLGTVTIVESVVFAFADPPPDTATALSRGERALAATFTVTAIGG
jgi:hypothetical protein